MKLTQVLTVFTAFGLLTACMDSADKTANKMETTNIGVGYHCYVEGEKQSLSAGYNFEQGKLKSADVMLNKAFLAQNLPLDSNYTEGTQFTDGKNVWVLSEVITPENAKKVVPIIFYIKGEGTMGSDRIMAKNCTVSK